MITNPYKVLGLPDGASEEECTKAYKRLAKKYHPDLNPDDKQAEKKMAEINAAYDQIKNGYTSSQNSYSRSYSYNGNGSTAPDYLKSAAMLIQSRQYAQAINLLNSIENRDAQWYYLCAIANIGEGNLSIAQDYIRTAYAKEPNNPKYQKAYNDIMNGINPMDFNPFSTFSDFGSYQRTSQAPNRNYTSRSNRGCLSRIFRIIIAIIVIRLIIRLILYVGYRLDFSKYYQGPQNSYSQQADNNNYNEYFGESDGEERTF